MRWINGIHLQYLLSFDVSIELAPKTQNNMFLRVTYDFFILTFHGSNMIYIFFEELILIRNLKKDVYFMMKTRQMKQQILNNIT